MTLTHASAVSNTLRHPAATSTKVARRTRIRLRAIAERAAGNAYRSNFGAASYSRADFDAMWADPDCPVRKRPSRAE